MKLKTLNIQNFKCFQNPPDIDFERLTIFTGANSSGKSSILNGILGSIQSGEFPFQFSTNGKYVNMGDFKEIAFKHLSKSEITVGFTFSNSKVQKITSTWVEDKQNNLPQLKKLIAESDTFKLSIEKRKDYELNYSYTPGKDYSSKYYKNDNLNSLIKTLSKLTEDVYQRDEKTGRFTKIAKKKGLTLEEYIGRLNKPQEVKDLKFEKLEDFLLSIKETNEIVLIDIFKDLNQVFKTYDGKVNYISSFRLHPERTYLEKSKSELKVEKFGEGYLDQIIYWQTKKTTKFNELIEVMKKLSLLQDITTKRLAGGRFEILVRIKENGTLTPLSDVGFGISQFLPIIVADLQLPEDSTFFIAQPEIHLHPSVQSSFGEYLVKQIESSKKNYVIETHSEYLLNRIRLAIVKGQLKTDDLSIYFLDNQIDGAILHKIEFTKDGQILNAPDDFFKTYMMDVMEIAFNAE